MKKLKFILIVIFAISNTVKGQDFCSTNSNSKGSSAFSKSSINPNLGYDTPNDKFYTIKIYPVIINDSLGKGGLSQDYSKEAINILKRDMIQYNINIYWDETFGNINEIDKNNFV